MLTRTDQHLLDALDARLAAIIMTPEESSDRNSLLVVLKLVGAERDAGKRQKLWQHFERTVGQSCRYLIPVLHARFDEVAAEVGKPSDLEAWIAAMKQSQLARRNGKTVEGDGRSQIES